MQSAPSHSGEMSQGSVMSKLHRTDVPKGVLDPAARRSKRAYNALSASSVGLELGIAVVIGVLGGMWLDTKAGTSPWLMLLCLVLGLVAGFRNVLRAVKRAELAAQDEAKRSPPSTASSGSTTSSAACSRSSVR
jgi:ATP synthase protein I